MVKVNKQPHQLDVIIPVKNEADNIHDLVIRIDQALTRANIAYQIIFVDDHSTDRTTTIIRQLSQRYPIRLHLKKGQVGKAYSLLEGSAISTAPFIAMIDGDLQYPPEALPQLYQLAVKNGMAVANRRIHQTSPLRRLASQVNHWLFGKLLWNLDCDIQSGLKVFRSEIISHLDSKDVTGWTLDLPLLTTALALGYSIGTVDIDFADRQTGQSKVNLFKATKEIAFQSLKRRLQPQTIFPILPRRPEQTIGAGVTYQAREFITHTRLPLEQSALVTLEPRQKFALTIFTLLLLANLLLHPLSTGIVLIAILSLIYFIDVFFNLFVLIKSLRRPPVICFTRKALAALDPCTLPVYTILCPLYHETEVLPAFLKNLDRLNWPKDKLDCLLLLEEDDLETKRTISHLVLPKFVRTLIVPTSLPKTKPKACNYGLAHARGEYLVIYDAEDRPDPLQLKKAYLGFQKSGREVSCLQSKLNYYNPRQNLLTRLFTAEYSFWFDLVLPGLQSIKTTIPLGGTSNHFRTEDLIALHAWDPFNVTEDCDLGVRLFQAGKTTAIINSTTYEEANSQVGNWLRQRSRWIKGYLQTYFVHLRHPWEFFRTQGIHALIFQLVVGMRISFMLINPFLWLSTLLYFTAYALVGPTIQAIYPAPVLYIAVFSLVIGNFIYIYNYMIACAVRRQWSLVKFIFFVPVYWLLTSAAAVFAVYQLITKPHFWEKTHHGLHLAPAPAIARAPVFAFNFPRLRLPRIELGYSYSQPKLLALLEDYLRRLLNGYRSKLLGVMPASLRQYSSGALLIVALVISNFSQMIFQAYLGRNLSFEEFGILSTLTSLLALSSIATGSISRTISHASAKLLGRYHRVISSHWRIIRHRVYTLALLVTLVWLATIPVYGWFFHTSNNLPFLLFTPVWMICLVAVVDRGFLEGNHRFTLLALSLVVEAVSKLVLTFTLVTAGHPGLIYLVLPLSLTVSFLVTWAGASRLAAAKVQASILPAFHLPKNFFTASLLANLSSACLLSFDLLLAKHFLSPVQAGQYALLSLSGKMVYFSASLFTTFVNPVISRLQGARLRHRQLVTFYLLFLATAFSGLTALLIVGPLGNYTLPLIFGPRILAITPFTLLYGIAMLQLALSASLVTFHQIKGRYLFPAIGLVASSFLISSIIFNHADILTIARVMAVVSSGYFFTLVFLHYTYGKIASFGRNILDLVWVFSPLPAARTESGKIRILVFNWRDCQHRWAGGAEEYLHQLARRWASDGHFVTLFCGNDGHHPRYQVVDGVHIHRHGGFYTVYFWAAIYYLFKFRGRFDAVIDSENGIPFFTPLYARCPVFLLIYHVHQQIFHQSLIRPLAWLAKLLESRLIPLAYQSIPVITISPSSKKDILTTGLTNLPPQIVYSGVDIHKYHPGTKSSTPLVIYLGRLKAYKSLPVLIQAAARVIKNTPQARFIIAGFGEERVRLQKLIANLHLTSSVKIIGRVSEQQKVRLYQRAWVFVNPSLMEGWGITTIEANACGTPVVASRVPGLMDSVHNPHTGFLVPYGNVTAFADKITLLLQDHELRNRISANSLSWAKCFDWDASAVRFLSLMKQSLPVQSRLIYRRPLFRLQLPNLNLRLLYRFHPEKLFTQVSSLFL